MFSVFSSISELDKIARKNDQLIPPMPENMRYENLVSLNESYVYEIMSIPRIGYYMLIMLKKKDFANDQEKNEAINFKDMLGQLDNMNFKNLFNSFHFSKMSRLTEDKSYEEEKVETKIQIKGTLLPENQKNYDKAFIFANVFTLLQKYFIKYQTECVSSALSVLDSTVIHLPQKLFSDDENFLDTNFNFFILRNQLSYLVDSRTVKILFGLVLPQSSETLNPQSVISLCKIY